MCQSLALRKLRGLLNLKKTRFKKKKKEVERKNEAHEKISPENLLAMLSHGHSTVA